MGDVYQNRDGEWMTTTGDGYRRKLEPCVEHNGNLPCTLHLNTGYPESKLELHSLRFLGGLLTVILVSLTGLLFRWLITSFGMWVVYAPVIAFFSACALYLLGWGVAACFRLAAR